jgi:hypothetical protein
MRVVALILLGGVFIANDTANWLAERSHFSAAWLFYMLQGWWVLVLSCVLLVFILLQPPSIWKNISVFSLVVSMVEAGQIPLCRAAVDDIKNVPAGVDLCDYVTGVPIGAATTTLYAAILAWIVGSWAWKSREA